MKSEKSKHSMYHNSSRLNKAVNNLVGLIEGITIDGVINHAELGLLNMWLSDHTEFRDRHPFNELIPVIERAIVDRVINESEQQDILWLCEKLRSTEFYDEITADIQILHGILGGIASDGVVTEDELKGLRCWVDEHEHLRTCYPYDEIDSLIISVMADGQIDKQEQKLLQQFFSEFLSVLDDRTITSPLMLKDNSIKGICVSCPEIIFEGAAFCFTGTSKHFSREGFEELVRSLGGTPSANVTKQLNYLVIGSEGNKCWAYACYGRKVEKAVELRKQGVRLLIIHENDFHDALADAR